MPRPRPGGRREYLRQGKHVIKVTKRQTMTLVYPDQGQNRKLDEEGKDVV